MKRYGKWGYGLQMRLKHFNIVFLLIVITLLFIKVYTAQVTYHDDPTVYLVLKRAPSLDNYVVDKDCPDKSRVIIMDENDYVGSTIYSHVVSWGWIVIPMMGVMLNVVALKKRYFAQFGKYLRANYVSILAKVLKLTAWGLLVLSILCWGLILFRIIEYPENHIGFNILWLNVLFCGVLIVGLLWLAISRELDRLAAALVAIGIASTIGILCLYYYDILVPYDEWLRRGMPDRPF